MLFQKQNIKKLKLMRPSTSTADPAVASSMLFSSSPTTASTTSNKHSLPSSNISSSSSFTQPRSSKIKYLIDKLVDYQELKLNREWEIVDHMSGVSDSISTVWTLESDHAFTPCSNSEMVSEKFVLRLNYQSNNIFGSHVSSAITMENID